MPEVEDHAAPERDDDGDGELWARVRELAPRQRAVLTLRYAASLTHGEIATALSCSEEAARRAAADGIKALRKEMPDVASAA